MSLYLITGGAGFIGSHIAKRLLKLHEKVRVLDNLSTGNMDNIASILNKIEFIEGDMNDPYTLERAVEGADYVIHQAARVSAVETSMNLLSFQDSNVNGTLLLLEACQKFNVKRLVLASSAAIYGPNQEPPFREDSPVTPLSPFGIAKYIDELYAGLFYDLFGLETVCLRYFNVYGPGQNMYISHTAVIPQFINKLLRDEPVEIYGDGEKTRDYIYIDDVVNANLLACWQPNLGGEVFNIGTGYGVSFNKLYAILSDIIGNKREPRYIPHETPMHSWNITHSVASIEKVAHKIGFKPMADLPHGLHCTVDWFLKELTNVPDLKVV